MAGSPRFTRFPLRLGLLYRRTGEAEWRQGRIENISGSGVLFAGEAPLEPNIGVEMSFELFASTGKAGARVLCCGQIVRAAPGGTAAPLLAATISDYLFVRPPAA